MVAVVLGIFELRLLVELQGSVVILLDLCPATLFVDLPSLLRSGHQARGCQKHAQAKDDRYLE